MVLVLSFSLLIPIVTSDAVSGDINFDEDENIVQNGNGQDDLEQWKDACGDDPNEYLIREHAASNGNGEMDPELTRDNRYVCADRTTDCAYNGNIYSQGQWADIGSTSSNDERGDEVNDPEVCLDLDSSKPGGEWYDMDNDIMRANLAGEPISSRVSSSQWDQITKYTNLEYYGNNPGTDQHIADLGEFLVDGDNVVDTTYNRKIQGYAVEDDCDPDLQACSDKGSSLSSSLWFNAGSFVEGDRQDNFDNSLSFQGVHNKMNDKSDQLEPGAETQENWKNIYGENAAINDSHDTTPGPDNWALTDDLEESIDNVGRSWDPGKCYYRPGKSERTDPTDPTDLKTEKIFGNSYAYVESGDGVWMDPDILGIDEAKFSCDLTGPDNGYGYKNTSVTNTQSLDGEWRWKNNDQSTHVIIGEFPFADQAGEANGFKQEDPVCGDDNKEYMIEEQGESANSADQEGRYACSAVQENCISYEGSDQTFYEKGSYNQAGEDSEDEGRLKRDKEACTEKSYNIHPTWYDQDFEANLCRENNIYGKNGVRWMDQEYVKNHPLAVRGGIDDDINPYLKDHKGESSNLQKFYDSKPNTDSWNLNSETPVSTGTKQDQVVTQGFCGGDDQTEYLATQECNTDLCETDQTIQGVAKVPGSCVFEAKNAKYDVNGYNGNDQESRKVYNPGETVELDLNPDQSRIISCFNGKWTNEWPVAFHKREITVPEGKTTTANFELINPRESSKTYKVELKNTFVDGPSAYQFTNFQNEESNSFTVTVPPETSKTYTVNIKGGSTELDGYDQNRAEILIGASDTNSDLSGEDSLYVNVIDSSRGTVNAADSESVPGIGMIQLIILTIIGTSLYWRAS